MKKRVEPSSALLALARRQGGCLTSAQCRDDGLSPTVLARLRGGRWTTTAYGIYCVHEPNWMSWAWTGLLAGGPGSLIGGQGAAHLDGLTSQAPPAIVVWVPNWTSQRQVHMVKFRKGRRRGHGSPRRTWPELSVLDAARDCTEDQFIALIATALSSGRMAPGMLLDAAATRSRQAHRKALVEMCTSLPGVESPLESRYVRNVVWAHGLPEGVRQVSIGTTRVDCLIEEFGVIVELDGRAYHERRRFRDMNRDNANLVERGMVTLRYGWHDVAVNPCAVARQLASLVSRRGWDGTLRRCRRCRSAARGD